MITVAPARAMNIAEFGIAVGAPAHLVVLDQSDVVDALRFHAPPCCVISHGRVVDLARMRKMAEALPAVGG
jgi:cytosine/creatinine deaminase